MRISPFAVPTIGSPGRMVDTALARNSIPSFLSLESCLRQHLRHGSENPIAGIDQGDPSLLRVELFEGVLEAQRQF